MVGTLGNTVADLNGNNPIDIIFYFAENASIHVLLGNENKTFQEAITFLLGSYPLTSKIQYAMLFSTL